MKKIILLSALSFIMQHESIAQTFDPTWANSFQTTLDNSVSTTPYRGASVAVFVPGQGMWVGVSGNSSVGAPVTAEMRFGIASITKTFIAVTLLKLQEQGMLTLNDHLYQWIPVYPNIDSTITIRQLLSHQSGISNFTESAGFWDSVWSDTSRFWTPQEVLPMVGPPYFAAGHGFYYSNTNYLLAGMIIEAATGNSWIQSLHNFILGPFSMDSTFVGAYELPNGPVAHEWITNNTIEIVNSPMTSLYSAMAAPAGIFSTPAEIVQFFNTLFSGMILAHSSFQELINFEPTTFYGLGIYTIQSGRPFIYNQGQMYGYASFCVYDPQTKSIMCILTNGSSTSIQPLFISMLNVLTTQYPKQPNDAGIVSIINPQQNICSATVIPSVSLKNFGNTTLTSVTVNYQFDSNTPSSFSWAGSLITSATATVVLPSLTAPAGFHLFTCYTTNPNGSTEGYTNNDTAKSEFIINTTAAVSAPYSESFDGVNFPPAGWIRNSWLSHRWGQTSMASYSGTACAARGNARDFANIGTTYDLDLPMINLTGVSNPALYFQHAYTNYPGRNDSLRILISSDCGVTWQSIFYKGGNSLRTIPASSYDSFYPVSSSQWKKDTILLAFSGEVLIRFRCINRNGNNLFIDDINIDQLPVGINEVAPKNTDINVYPNPARDHITIALRGNNKKVDVTITDITGKIIYKTSSPQTQKIEVNTKGFSEGVYLVQIQTEDFISTKKIIVAK